MKNFKLLLLSFGVLLALSSCKKSSSTPSTTGTITVTIDGSTQTFNFGAAAHVDNTSGFNSLSIIGVQSATSSNSLIIGVNSTTPIAAGTYTGASSQTDMSYTQSTGAIYQFDGGNSASNATVVIKSISSTTVQGTFSGTLELINGSGAATKTLANGSFNLNIK